MTSRNTISESLYAKEKNLDNDQNDKPIPSTIKTEQ